MDFGGFVEVLSSVEKRYGRSVSGIRTQASVWREILEQGEFILHNDVVLSEGQRWPVFVSFPQVKRYEEIFDIGKYVSLFDWDGVEFAMHLSDVELREEQWEIWLGMLSALKRRFSASIEVRKQSSLSLLKVIARVQPVPNLLLNLVVDNSFLSALKSGEKVEVLSDTLLNEDVEVEHIVELIETVRNKGIDIRFVSGDVERNNKLPMFGRQMAFTESGVALFPGEIVPAGWIDLTKFLERRADFWTLNWEKLEDRIKHCVRLLDDLMDIGVFPRDIFSVFPRARRISLGITNWAQLLWYMGIPYASDTAVEFAARLSCFIRDVSSEASWQLARERGVFLLYNNSLLPKEGVKRRNVSIWSGVGIHHCDGKSFGGIEPAVSIEEGKCGFDWFSECFQKRGVYSEQLLSYIHKNSSLSDLEYIPLDLRQIFVTRKDMDVVSMQRVQSAFQEFCDGIVDLSLENWDWKKGLWESFVRGSLSQRLLSYKDTENLSGYKREDFPIVEEVHTVVQREERPEVLFGSTQRIDTACGQLLITINQDASGRPRELLLYLSKTGGCVNSFLEALAKVVSLCLESGVPINDIISALSQINCSSLGWHNGKRVFSCADAVSQVLSERFGQGKEKMQNEAPVIRQVVQ